MPVKNFTLSNVSATTATLNQLLFITPVGIQHVADISSFGGYLSGQSAFTGTGTYPVEQATYQEDTRPEFATVITATFVTPNFFLDVNSTDRIKVGWAATGNFYNGETVLQVVSGTRLRMSGVPTPPPVTNIAVQFVAPDVNLLTVDSTTGISAGFVAIGNGYTVGQTVVNVVSPTVLRMSDIPNGTPTTGGVINFENRSPIGTLAPGASIPFTMDYTTGLTSPATFTARLEILADLGGPKTKVVQNAIVLSNVPQGDPGLFFDPSGGGGDSGPGPCSDSSSVSCSAGCFTSDTLVTMADGTKKRIADIKEGDYVQGVGGPNKVLKLLTFVTDTNSLYGFNNNDPFVTSCHPIKTDKGWAAFDPEYLKTHWPADWLMLTEDNKGPVEQISENSLIGFWRNGIETYEPLQDHVSIEVPKDFTVYNLMLDNDHTFVANDVIVHNKGECFTGDTLINIVGGTTKRIDQIQIGDLVVDALTGKPNRVIGVKITEYEAGRRLFATKTGVKPFITEQHAFYNSNNELCAMSDECEYLAPWLGPIKVVDVPEIETAKENITVYNLMFETGNSHYANGVPVSNMVGHGGTYVLMQKGFITEEEYQGYIYHLENTAGLNSLSQEQKAKVFNIVFKLSKYILNNDNLQSRIIAHVMGWAIRNRTTLYPYMEKWFKSRIRKWLFGSKK
jgi:hypothetical protein